MGRYFEKISYDNFKNTICDDKELYNSFNLPERKTSASAGYDFESLIDVVLQPGEITIMPTGVKVNMLEDEMLMIIIRSSLGFKNNIRLCNQVGIIDSDYYNNEDNEGHIFISIQNEGTKELVIHKKDRIAQGIFTKFLTVSNEKEINQNRKSGLGSTNKKEDDK